MIIQVLCGNNLIRTYSDEDIEDPTAINGDDND